MELWRISNYPDLSGIGGLRAAGRWHSQGRRIVYGDNYLLNPEHPDADKIAVAEIIKAPFDSRLLP